MRHYVSVRVRVERDIITHITRVLHGKGELQVSVGQEVTPDEIIGRALTLSGFRTVNLSSELRVASKEVKKYLKRDLGQKIYKGELLAYKEGWLLTGKKVVTAPTDGVLEFLNPNTGELRISFLPREIKLPAGVYGIVEQVDGDRGQVVIRTQVSRIFGIFGSGKLREGILHILGKKDDLITNRGIIQSKYSDHILVGGSLFSKDTISAAISSGVSGLISGGINARDYKSMAGGRIVFPKKLDNDIGISFVICEGFGGLAMGSDIFNMLTSFEGKFIFIEGNKSVISLPSFSSSSLAKIRNTRLPKIENLAPITETGELKIGQKVRIVGNAYSGEQGKLVAIDESKTLLASKIQTYLATVDTERRKIQVPVANLEVVV